MCPVKAREQASHVSKAFGQHLSEKKTKSLAVWVSKREQD